MKRLQRRRSSGSLAVAIAVHVVAIAALLQMVFRYPIGQLVGLSRPDVTQERLEYVTVPQPTQTSGASASAGSAGGSPAALRPPSALPNRVPLPLPAVPPRAQAAGGFGDGFGVSGSGLATGVVPRQPDKRIVLTPGAIVTHPRTPAETADSLLELAIGIARDSLELRRHQNELPRWTHKDKDGREWGLTPNYLALGRVKIPTALLALTALNAPQGMSPIEARSTAFIRRDVMENGQRAITEDEFRQSVKRIRERKERERRQNQLASKAAADSASP